MFNYKEKLEKIKTDGVMIHNSRKEWVGRIYPVRGIFPKVQDSVGYYQREDLRWVAFIQDSKYGLQCRSFSSYSEEQVIERILQSLRFYELRMLQERVLSDPMLYRFAILENLINEYDYSAEKANSTMAFLESVNWVPFEFWYYLKNGEFVDDEFAHSVCGYTAKQISGETGMSPLAAFNYLVCIAYNNEEAELFLKRHFLNTFGGYNQVQGAAVS